MLEGKCFLILQVRAHDDNTLLHDYPKLAGDILSNTYHPFIVYVTRARFKIIEIFQFHGPDIGKIDATETGKCNIAQ